MGKGGPAIQMMEGGESSSVCDRSFRLSPPIALAFPVVPFSIVSFSVGSSFVCTEKGARIAWLPPTLLRIARRVNASFSVGVDESLPLLPLL